MGLLINFNVLHLRDGIKRMVDGRDWEKEFSVNPCAPCGESHSDYARTTSVALHKFSNFFKKFLHLWKFPVISSLRTNFSPMPGIL